MKTHSQAPTRFRVQRLSREISLIFGASTMLALPMALAAPQGGTVTAGQAAIQQNGALTTITQGSQRAAIDWRSFNVGANETVNFVQPNASAAILNRVVGNDPSAIFGRVTANGQVLLINPNGILFGRTAQVDVGALTATTSNLSNADFMAGRLNFNEPGKAGATVENQGRITVAEGGFVALVGRQVANSGVITARLGKVALAGGDAFVLDLYGDKLVNLIVDPAAMNALTDANGQPLAARVDHSGEIVADGGRVQLSVATVKQLVDNLINLSGVVRATSFTSAPGVISLQGDANTRVNVSGTLDTSGERGGRVEVTGRDVNLQSGATLAATGGQGSIAVGGDWQGRGTLVHADNVNVAQGASLDASGGSNGDGGTVVLWSDKNTQFAGRIDANGGSTSGNAGQVEVSSKGTLGFQGDVGVFATNGQQGSLLLDPLNLTIAATNSGDSQVSADQIRYFLTRGTNVTLSADQNVTVNAEVNGLVAGGGGTAGGGLTLTAGNNLAVNQSIVLNNGALNLTATNGTLTQANGTVLYTGTGAANLRGGAGVDLGQVLSGGAVDIRSANGAVTVRNALVAATSNGSAAPLASLNVDGAGAVSLNGALVQGNANVASRNAGVSLATAVIQSNAGNVLVEAAAGLASTGNNVGLVAQGTVTANAGQSIALDAVLGNGQVALTSTGGAVSVRQAITGTNGSSPAQGLDVTAAGLVTLGGANVGAGGIDITSSGNAVTLNSGSLYSAGPVNITAQGNVVLGTGVGISTTGSSPVAITSRAGSITVGNGGINADGEGVNITLCSGITGGTPPCRSGSGDINVNGDIRTRAGTISLSAPGGAVRVMATYAEQDAPVDSSLPTDVRAANRAINRAANATLDAGTDPTRSRINVSAGGATAGTGSVVMGEMIAYNSISVTSTNGDVVLKRGLGGNERDANGVFLNTGYVNYDDGYNGAVGHRPTVGRLVIDAGRSVELNGLNLDGNASPTDTANPGLSVTAGRVIVSNNEIAVNKGDIELTSRGTGPTDGVYLGSSVYSRGHDVVGPNGRQKTGYAIRIGGSVLGLFDNTAEMAQLPINTYVTSWTENVNGVSTRREVTTDAEGFVVNQAGFRVQPSAGTYQLVAYRGGQYGVYTVLADKTIAPGQTDAGSRLVGIPGVATDLKQEIAKIEIANNAANYQDSAHMDWLVPVTPGGLPPSSRVVDINAGVIAGVANHAPQANTSNPIRIAGFVPSLTSLSETRIQAGPGSQGVLPAQTGIGLKVLTFQETGDLSTYVWSHEINLSEGGSRTPFFGTGYNVVSPPVNGVFEVVLPFSTVVRSYTDAGGQLVQESAQLAGSQVAVYQFRIFPRANGASDEVRYVDVSFRNLDLSSLTTTLPAGSTLVTPWHPSVRPAPGPGDPPVIVSLNLYQPGIAPGVGVPGTAMNVDLTATSLYNPAGPAISLTGQSAGVLAPTYTEFRSQLFQGAYDSPPTSIFADTQLRNHQLTNVLADSSSVGDYANRPGTRVFVYDGIINSSRGSHRVDGATGVIIPSLTGIPGFNNSTVGFAGVGAGFDGMVRGGATGNPATGALTPSGQSGTGVGPVTDDRSTQDTAGGGVAPPGSPAGNSGDVIFSARPSAQADLGRGGPVPGSVVNVFKRQYRVVSSSDPSVCAPGAVQQSAADGAGATRECAP